MARKSNAKGSAFERLVCRKLTEWITGSPTPEIFWRSATSGAKATQDRKAGRKSNMGGDIVAVAPEGQQFINRYSIECKDRKTYGKLESIAEGWGPLLKWWVQCANDAKQTERLPLMIYKAKGTPLNIAHLINTGFREPRLFFNCPVYNEGVGIVLFEEWLAGNKWVQLGPARTVAPGVQMRSKRPIRVGK